VKMRSGYPAVWSECRCVANAVRSSFGSRPLMPRANAAAARRTTPGPKSTRYGTSSTTIATAGPNRSGSAFGVPVPRRTSCVRGATRPLDPTAPVATSVAAMPAVTMALARRMAAPYRSLRKCGIDSGISSDDSTSPWNAPSRNEGAWGWEALEQSSLARSTQRLLSETGGAPSGVCKPWRRHDSAAPVAEGLQRRPVSAKTSLLQFNHVRASTGRRRRC
jgi:hypothetical protein